MQAITNSNAAREVLVARLAEHEANWRAAQRTDDWLSGLGSRGDFERDAETQRIRRCLTACDELASRVAIGARIYWLAELPAEVQALVWQALVDHGDDAASWPAEVQRAIQHAPPRRSHEELYAERVAVARAVRDRAARTILEAHGANPASWPTEDLDELARLDGRLAAMAAVRDVARAQDVEWSIRKAAAAPVAEVPKTEAELAADREREERHRQGMAHNALIDAASSAAHVLAMHDAETAMLERMDPNGSTPERRKQRATERAKLAKRVEAARAALEERAA